jgi:hypothetical protein
VGLVVHFASGLVPWDMTMNLSDWIRLETMTLQIKLRSDLQITTVFCQLFYNLQAEPEQSC